MTDFNGTPWSRKDYARRYVEAADIIVPQRRVFLHLLVSFYRRFLGGKAGRRILDLGCGDGFMTEGILRADPDASATLVDASPEMIDRAKERLKDFGNTRFVRSTLEEIAEKGIAPGGFDLAFSALAIHHLEPSKKLDLFACIHSHLAPGGFFINMDDCIPPSDSLEDWYVDLWREEMTEKEEESGRKIDRERFIRRHMEGEHHSRLETIGALLKKLEEAGYREVECYYKYGMFAMYGGRR